MGKIDIKNLSLMYGDCKVLTDINLSIEEKQVTAFIGPSGCGKSSLLKILNRMNDLVEYCNITGQVLVDGRIYEDMDVNPLKKQVGMVLKKPNPFTMKYI